LLRHQSLIPLSQQHHNGLALCVLTRRGLSKDRSVESIEKLARRAIDRYELELTHHFDIEERILFPAIRQHLGEVPLVGQLIAEHRAIEAMVGELRVDPTIPALEDLCALLTSHIRREENELFEDAQRCMPAGALEEIGRLVAEKVIRVCL